MNPLKVAAIQIGPEPSKGSASENTIERLINKAVEGEAEFLCFPEHWLGEETPKSVSELIELMREQARRFNVTIIAGGFFEQLPDGIYVTAPVIDPNGHLVGRQRKIHLFGDEKAKAKPGSEHVVFDVNNLKFGVMVCYDTVFPEVARTFAIKGVEMVFVPSRILNAGTQPWHLYLMTRCLENRLPIVASNLVWPPRHSGHSMILDLRQDSESTVVYPNVLSTGEESFAAVVAEVNLDTARKLRESRLKERRPNTYRVLSES